MRPGAGSAQGDGEVAIGPGAYRCRNAEDDPGTELARQMPMFLTPAAKRLGDEQPLRSLELAPRPDVYEGLLVGDFGA